MNGNSDIYGDRDERRRLRRERREARRAMRGQCDSLAHAVRGPITLITVGALFAINNFTPYGFDKTWPVILIVFGLLTLVGRSTAPLMPPEAPAAPAPPNFGSTPPASSYRESAYSQPAAAAPSEAPPSGTAKGGFGTSAPPRQGEQEGRPPHLGETL
jgi:predicted lipid-binding transport protein (Tim44 family)